eukprot:COSAG05_NODE_1033_length_6088_cov_21.220738_8_plen_143_part_00
MGALYICGPRVGRWASLRPVLIPSAALLQPRTVDHLPGLIPGHSLMCTISHYKCMGHTDSMQYGSTKSVLFGSTCMHAIHSMMSRGAQAAAERITTRVTAPLRCLLRRAPPWLRHCALRGGGIIPSIPQATLAAAVARSHIT